MNGPPLSLVLLPTLECNVACDYCFEEKARVRLSRDGLERLTAAILDHMETMGAADAELYWQGGEALLLGPAWFESAHESMAAAAAARGRGFRHYLQSNLIGYGSHWNMVIRAMFDGAVGTSMDYPNDHRRLKNGSTERYTSAWLDAVAAAREAGLKVSAIAVLHPGSLRAGAEAFLDFFAGHAGLDDLQVNLPFPGGPAKGGDTLDGPALSRFLVDLVHAWAGRAPFAPAPSVGGLRLSPFADLVDYYLGRPARLPCIWQANCANQFMAIDARGEVALCDCWVTSYPRYRFGNVFGGSSLSDLLRTSAARQQLLDRPGRLMNVEDCASCPDLASCHGGCPVRTLASKGTVEAKDPYCDAYKAVFAACREVAGTIARKNA